MPATPTYDEVIEDLHIDPGRIAARPKWSFEVAERVRKHQKKAQRSAAPKKRTQPKRNQRSRSRQSQSKRPAAASKRSSTAK